jgi:hypothetical protein
LTNDYQIQGIWQENGQWYFNAQAVRVLNLVADLITAGKLVSRDGTTVFDLDDGAIRVTADDYKNRKIEIYAGKLNAYDGNGKKRIIVGSQEDWASVYFLNPSGTIIGGIQGGEDDDFWVYCKNTDTGALTGKRVGWRQIKDANGNLVTCLAQY